MFIGVQYYPEHWPKERWETDASLMAEAGVDTVRMGEFAWSAYESVQGSYTLDWMERAISVLADAGIQTLLCTCSRTPPLWLFKHHPGITNVAMNGERQQPGKRYTYCPTNDTFARVATEIDRMVVTTFSGNEAVMGWQIDNEVGGGNDCYCDTCLQAFSGYLEKKYGSPENLNNAWGEHFWSFRIKSFDEIPMVQDRLANPQLALEYRRFQSTLNCEFVRQRAELIRGIDPGTLVTTNFQSAHAKHTDYHTMADSLDVNGCNYYPFRSPELLLDYYRGDRKKFFVLEQFTRLEEVDSGPGWMSSWAWTAIAHGATGINFFRWRVSRNGREMFADGIIPQSGRPARRYDELKTFGRDLDGVRTAIDGTQPMGVAAIVYAYESRWAVENTRIPGFDPLQEAVCYHEALLDLNIPTDVMDPRKDLSPYSFVIAPRAFLFDDLTAANLIGYARAGGTLILTAGSGVVDEYGRCYNSPRPGPLSDAAGITVSDLSSLSETLSIGGTDSWLEGWSGSGAVAADEIHPVTAQIIATYQTGWRSGLPAVTSNPYGDGAVVYVGTVLEEQSVSGFLTHLSQGLGVSGLMNTVNGIRVYRRVSDTQEIWFVINRIPAAHTVVLPEPMEDLRTGMETTEVSLSQTEVAILRKRQATLR